MAEPTIDDYVKEAYAKILEIIEKAGYDGQRVPNRRKDFLELLDIQLDDLRYA